MYLARHPTELLGRIAFAICTATVSLWLAVRATAKLREADVGWRVLIIAWVTVMAVIYASSSMREARVKGQAPRVPVAPPVGCLDLEDTSRDMPRDMAVTGHLALLARNHRLSVVDLSDSSQPRETAHLDLPQWRMESVAASEGQAYLLGVRTEVDSGIVRVDLTNPMRPRQTGALMVGSGKEIRRRFDLVAADGYLVTGVVDETGARLLSMRMGTTGPGPGGWWRRVAALGGERGAGTQGWPDG